MKGIILAGGSGTRLYPLTHVTSKQLLPVYDKPMIYYPLSTLMLAGIKDILIISTPNDKDKFENLLGDGSSLGIKLNYKEQPSPDGLAQAFILGKDFIGQDDVCLILGDNIFYGHQLPEVLKLAKEKQAHDYAVVFAYHVNSPEKYGVAEFDENHNVISVEEKPKNPKSKYAITGLYFYPNDVVKKVSLITPSERGELEITSLNAIYLEENRLKVELLGRGFAWLDTGSHESLIDASNFIETIENRQGLKVAAIEEVAFEMGYISRDQLIELAEPLNKNQYGKYLIDRANKN
jgi:glucose-1-phosphate thymidylyltransferase